MGRFHLAQNQRSVSQNARQRVVEIQRDGSTELQRALELLFLGGACVDRVLLGIRKRGRSRGFAKKLKDEILLTVLCQGTNVSFIDDGGAAFNVEFQGGHRRLRAIHANQKLIQGRFVFRRPNGVKHRSFPFEHSAESCHRGTIGTADKAGSVHQQRGPVRVLQHEINFKLHFSQPNRSKIP